MTDDNDNIRFSRRKLLGGLGAVGAAGALGGAATNALLWDEEIFGTDGDPNVLQAGQLDLKVGWDVRYFNGITDPASDDHGDLGTVNATSADEAGAVDGLVDNPGPLVNLVDVKPGDVIEQTLSLHVYDNPGFVSMGGAITADEDNGIVEPEDMVDGTEDDSDGDPFTTAGLGIGAAGLLAGAVPGRLLGDVGENEETAFSKKNALRGAGAATAVGAGLGAMTGTAAAQPGFSVTPGAGSAISAQDLAESLVPDESDIEIVAGSASYTGASDAGGTFSGGDGTYGIDEGVILSSGDVTDVAGPNDSDGTSTGHETSGDSDLLAITDDSVTETNDAAVLEFEFTVPADADEVFFNYVFGSDEYNEFVDDFNDVFGFFVNGTNAAVVGGGPASIDNINTEDNSDVFNNNDPSDLETVPFDTEMDGFTDVLTIEAPVDAGETNSMKLAIADANDDALDSWVFIEGDSLGTEPTGPSDEGDDGDGELDNLMECVIWYDGNDTDGDAAGDNFPSEITDYTPDQQEQFLEDLRAGDVTFDEAADEYILGGSVREVFTELENGELLNPAGETPDAFPGSICFRPSTTHYVGVLCWLPRDIPGVDDNIIQTDRVEFFYGFDAVQCRHNVNSDGGPIDFPGDAEAGIESGDEPGDDEPTPITSTFDVDDESWLIQGDAESGTPTYNASGGNPGGHICANDDVAGGTWYFAAPSDYHGDRSDYYDGSLSFDLKQSSTSSPFSNDDIVLSDGSTTIVYDFGGSSEHPGTDWTPYDVPLSETDSGWTYDGTSDPVSQSDFQAVLGGLSRLEIRGEYRSGSDTGCLDSVELSPP